jgi:hypothetical protein
MPVRQHMPVQTSMVTAMATSPLPDVLHGRLRIPTNPNTRYDVFEHPGAEAAERPTRGLVRPLTISSLSTVSA